MCLFFLTFSHFSHSSVYRTDTQQITMKITSCIYRRTSFNTDSLYCSPKKFTGAKIFVSCRGFFFIFHFSTERQTILVIVHNDVLSGRRMNIKEQKGVKIHIGLYLVFENVTNIFPFGSLYMLFLLQKLHVNVSKIKQGRKK